MIPVRNIYYLLAYAFDALGSAGVASLDYESFDGAADLLAELMLRGLERQVLRGVTRGYEPHGEEVASVRGRVDVARSVREASVLRRRLWCSFDEFTEDVPLNRVVKAAGTVLLSSGIDRRRRRQLRHAMGYLGGVRDVDPRRVRWDVRFDSGNASYRPLYSLSRLVIEGAIQGSAEGGLRFEALSDDQMCRLYERFLLRYFQREHAGEVHASASYVGWALDGGEGSLLPVMRTDVTLREAGRPASDARTLIIDAKYYGHTLQERFGKRSVHSGNLYQVFTYVKNEASAVRALGGDPAGVSGMLLYAQTDEHEQPHESYVLDGNRIDVRTLDLSQPFEGVRAQLDGIVGDFFLRA